MVCVCGGGGGGGVTLFGKSTVNPTDQIRATKPLIKHRGLLTGYSSPFCLLLHMHHISSSQARFPDLPEPLHGAETHKQPFFTL